MRITILITCLFLFSASIFSNCLICKQALQQNYDVFSAKNDSEYIVSLHRIYNLSKNEYSSKRSSEGLDVFLPEYGSLEYNNNKSKVNSIYEKYYEKTDFDLTYKEHKELLSLTISETVRLKSLSEFTKCMALCNKLPNLTIDFFNKKDVIITISLPLTRHNSGESTKIKNIITSSGLQFSNNNTYKPSSSLTYGESYSLFFTRSFDEKQFISIDLEKEERLYLNIPAIKNDPIYEWKFVSIDKDGKPLKLKSETIEVDPFKVEIRGIKIITNSIIKKGIIDLNMTKDLFDVGDISYDIIEGSLKVNEKNIILESGRYYLKYSVTNTSNIKTKFIFYVYYSELKKVCVKNCE